MIDINRYVGIPYVAGGREIDGLDCYGLLRLVLIDVFHVELPRFPVGIATPQNLSRALTKGTRKLASSGRLLRVHEDNASREPHIVVSWHDGIAVHCGLRLGLRLLHTSAQAGRSELERFDHYRRRTGDLECYAWAK